MQPITTEEAVLCLEYLDHDFYVYNNKETKKISGASAVTCAQRSRETTGVRACVCACVCVWRLCTLSSERLLSSSAADTLARSPRPGLRFCPRHLLPVLISSLTCCVFLSVAATCPLPCAHTLSDGSGLQAH